MKSVNQYVMKDSGVQWIGQVPEHWEVCRVKDLFMLTTGGTPKDFDQLNDEEETIDWYTPIDIKEDANELFTSKRKLSLTLSQKNNIRIFPAHSLLFSGIGNVGKIGYLNNSGYANQQLTALMPKRGYSKYYYYFLAAFKDPIKDNAFYTVVPIVNNSYISAIPIALPPLSEQRAIADWLDAKCADIDAAIELQQRMIDKLKAYKTAVIHQAVTKGLDKNLKPTDLKDSGIKWLGMIPKHWDVVLVKNILRWKSVKGCGEKEVLSLYREYGVIPKSSRDDNHNVTSDNTDDYKLVEKGDFVINKMKAWQGSMGVSLYEGIISPAYYVCSFINEKVYKPYFHYLMRDSSYLPEYKRLSGGIRVGQWDLAYDKFKSLPALLPPTLSEQRAIADWLDAKCADIDATIALKEQKQEKLKAYKKTIIFEYVTGKKQVTNINKQL